jgi:PAS domain S-box-containing protein
MFGFTRDEAVGELLVGLVVPPDCVDEERRIQRDALEREVAVYESVRRRKDGSLVHVSASTKAIREGDNGDLQYVLSTKKDVTHLKVLRDSKLVDAKLRDLFESTPDAISYIEKEACRRAQVAAFLPLELTSSCCSHPTSIKARLRLKW